MGETERRNLTEEDIIAIVTRELPRLVVEHPEIHDKFVDVMSDVYAKKSDQTVLLSEIKSLREDFQTSREEFQTSREEFQTEMKALREEFQASREEFQAEMKGLREEFQTSREEFQVEMKAMREEFQAEMKALREESEQRFEEHSREIKDLREDFQSEVKALREEIQTEAKALREEIQTGLRLLDNKIVGLGARWGIMSEEAFRNGLKGILTEEVGLKVERYEGYDEEGYVFGHPDQIELDVIVKDGILIIIEIRSSMSRSDVYTFQRKIEFYEKIHDVKVNRKIVLSPFIDHRVIPVANSLRVETYSSASDVRA